MDMRELFWAAGFIEGEGCLLGARGAGTRVVAVQVHRPPVERLQRLFGGTIKLKKRNPDNPKHNAVHTWWVSGPRARGVMMTLYPLMSPKRQGQIVKALSYWLSCAPHGFRGTHCPRGHEYTKANTYIYPSGARQCLACHKVAHKRYREKVKAYRAEHYGAVLEQERDWKASHCRAGHERTPENTYTTPGGRKMCKICRLAAKRAYHHREKARKGIPDPMVKNSITHCKHGHEYTLANTYIVPATGVRICRTCAYERGKRYREEHRSQPH